MKHGTIVVVFLVAGCFANAQSLYQAIILHPDGLGSTFALGAANGVQVGYHGVFGTAGIIWRGSPESAVFVRPVGSSTISLHATDGTRHVGQANFGRTHALMWLSDNSEDYVDLHVAEFLHTSAGGIHGDEQVGIGWLDSGFTEFHALLWRGTAGSMVNLHPTGELWSIAEAVHSGRQVGAVSVSIDAPRAALWHGTAESFVDLSNNVRSHALGVHGDQQVGWIDPAGPTVRRAALWFGTAESYVNLGGDAPSVFSAANSTNGVFQVGGSGTSGQGRAVRWSGSAESKLDLSQFLPPEYQSEISVANFIDESGIIVGSVGDPFSNLTHAVMWVPVPEPATLSVIGLSVLALALRRRRK